MWTLRSKHRTAVTIGRAAFTIPADDVTFLAVLKRGATAHSAPEGTRVQCEHLGDLDAGQCLVFSTTLLEASYITSQHADFAAGGLMGRWKLVTPRKGSSEPFIKLLHAFDDATQFLGEAQGLDNPAWVREAYVTLGRSE